MEDIQIQQFVSAFAAGCLDNENFVNFKEYLLSDGDLPERELGELQNTIALIPTILEIEQPDHILKGLVAKRLISLKDEIKEKIKEEKIKDSLPKFLQNTKKPEEKKEVDPIKKVEVEIPEKTTLVKETDLFEEVEEQPAQKPFKEEPVKIKEKLLHKTDPKLKTVENLQLQTSKAKISFLLKFIIFILFLALAAIGWFAYTLQNSYKKTEADLKKTTAQLEASNKLVQEKNTIPSFLIYPEVSLVNLKSADKTAKLFISFDTNSALLFLTDFQPAPASKSYQLWFKTKDVDYSICIFEPTQRTKFIEIKDFPLINKADIKEFIITIEPVGGSGKAVGEIFMRGIF